MTMPHPNQGQQPNVLGWLEVLGKLPSPDKVFAELQRLNNNLEKMQPDLTKIGKAVDGLYLQDIRNLALTLQGMKISEMLLALNEANSTIKNLYDKLWSKK